MSEDSYKILSVESTASQNEIQQATDGLISNWSEKQGMNNNRKRNEIRNATAVLSDPVQKFEYDTVQIPEKLNYENLEKSIAAMVTDDFSEVKHLFDIKPLSKSASLKGINSVKIIDEISVNREINQTDISIIGENIPIEEKFLNMKQSLTTVDLTTLDIDHEVPLDTQNGKKGKKPTVKNWKEIISKTEISSRPVETVSASKRIAGTEVKTVYSFGSNAEFIDVFMNDKLKIKIINDENHEVYSDATERDDLPPGVIVGVSTVIAANNCIITTEVTRREKRESIVVYKDEILLCRTGSAILEDYSVITSDNKS